MSKDVKQNVINLWKLKGVVLDKEVNKCPTCNKGIKPVYLNDCVIDDEELIIIQYCPICEEIIIATYNVYEYNPNRYCLNEIYPYDIGDEVSENQIIKEISPKFYEILKQSKAAEAIGLNEICGIGYRKSLEYLIKDYAILKNPDKADEIKETALKKCIDKYIHHETLKKCAVGAVFIGNDETHYIRKWETKDISDLKELINMAVLWIELAEQTERYSNEMDL